MLDDIDRLLEEQEMLVRALEEAVREARVADIEAIAERYAATSRDLLPRLVAALKAQLEDGTRAEDPQGLAARSRRHAEVSQRFMDIALAVQTLATDEPPGDPGADRAAAGKGGGEEHPEHPDADRLRTELEDQLAGSDLAGRSIAVLAVPGSGEPAFLVETAAATAYQDRRSLARLDRTPALVPVVITSFAGADGWHDAMLAGDPLGRFEYQQETDAGDAGALAILDQASAIDADAALHEIAGERSDDHDHARSESVDQELDGAHGRHLDWFEPTHQPLGLLALPIERPADALAYLHFFGAQGHPVTSALMVALLRLWETRYGATLVAHFGTKLHFEVERPPATVDAAWDLAQQQVCVAECTAVLPGVALRDHARALVGRPTWFLHERP